MNVEPQPGVTWESGIPNSKERQYAHTKTGALRKNINQVSISGNPVYRHDRDGFCYYRNRFLMGCYSTLNELNDQIRMMLYQQGGTRRKIHKQKRRITKKRRITRRTRK